MVPEPIRVNLSHLVGWESVVERLLALAREELGIHVAFAPADAGHGGASLAGDPGEAEEGVMSVPLVLPDGRVQGTLRLRGRERSALENDARFIRVIARLVEEQLASWEESVRAWQERISSIRSLLDGEHLAMLFQPIAELDGGTVVGVEALARFAASPSRSPEEWFAEAESIGLRVELELFTLSAALRALDTLPEGMYLAVNVSPSTAVSVRLAMALEGVPLDRLVLEVTEHAAVHDYERLVEALAPLREQGLRLAVDDAGSGFASLRHIIRLSPDFIKLDPSLTRRIDHDSALRALGISLMSFAAAVDASIIAEGIESADELDVLRSLNVPYGQGAYLADPGPLPAPVKVPSLDGAVSPTSAE